MPIRPCSATAWMSMYAMSQAISITLQRNLVFSYIPRLLVSHTDLVLHIIRYLLYRTFSNTLLGNQYLAEVNES